MGYRAPPQFVETAATVTDPPTGSMASDWDAVYGAGFYVAHVLGSRLYGRAVVTGTHGTTLTVEMYKPDISNENLSSGSIRGVAKDSNGNLSKVTF
jgi:hypothetical protein